MMNENVLNIDYTKVEWKKSYTTVSVRVTIDGRTLWMGVDGYTVVNNDVIERNFLVTITLDDVEKAALLIPFWFSRFELAAAV